MTKEQFFQKEVLPYLEDVINGEADTVFGCDNNHKSIRSGAYKKT